MYDDVRKKIKKNLLIKLIYLIGSLLKLDYVSIISSLGYSSRVPSNYEIPI